MRRSDLEHIIRAASGISGERELLIIGTASLLGTVPNPPDELARSRDADLYPLRRPELADLIDGSIGEGSPFEEAFGCYAQGVGPNTAKLPAGWDSRLVKVQSTDTNNNIGYCLEPHDLAASKLAAGREKDREFVRAMARHHLLDAALLQQRVTALPIEDVHKERLKLWVSHQLGESREKTPRPGGRGRGR